MTEDIPHPKIVAKDEWLAARKQLLEQEKELTRQADRLSAARRRLPMVKIDKPYELQGSDGKQTLVQLFEGKHQLIVYHFMFDPTWDKGCEGCTGFVDAIADLSLLDQRDTRFVLVSRAPIEKLDVYKKSKGWTIDWYSSLGSDFNYDFHATMDAAVAPVEHNYRTEAEWTKVKGKEMTFTGEAPGLSVFFRLGDDAYHSYSTYGRGVENLVHTYSMLDVTPYGRQEDWEDSPEGWPQKPTYG